MGSDRARISFDRTREYRSVVTQQGRVTLEADVNEQAVIASEALRLETIDIIGPTATPDNGYLVSIDANGDLVVGPGIMYVGGWRMEFNQPVPVANQPEWIDQPPTIWAKSKGGLYVIALLVTEQEVQAVEDQALREVALGGPDTGARTRLMQHIVAVPTRDRTCAAVLKDWDTILKPLGLALQPDTLALDFNAALQVSFYPPAGPSDPCCPPAQGGYLGADNQLIRVTVTSYDASTHTGTLLWGWNNASFLYRGSLLNPTANPQILTLSPAPVDAAHTPQLNQVIEVLRSTMELGNPSDLNFIAAPEGDVITLAASGTVFDPTTNQLTLPTGTTLPADYASDSNPLFVRLWQAEVPFTDGTAVKLDDVSGLAVTIHMTALPTGPLEARPFWDFAVRPNTPQQVYPQRYLQSPQGPTGPRRWLTDLAIIQYVPSSPAVRDGGFKIVADCRVPFPAPTSVDEECGCCGITLNAAQVAARGGLQAVVDAQAKLGQSLSLRPGRYVLDAPLAFSSAHAGFLLSGCSPGARVQLSANSASLANFTAGMLTITGTSNITIQGLSFSLPLAPFQNPTQPIGTTAQFTTNLAFGINIQNSTSIVIEDCAFLFASPDSSPNNPVLYGGAGIYAYEDCSGLRVLRNRFQCLSGGNITSDASRALAGIWMSPSAMSPVSTLAATTGTAAQPNAAPQATADFVNLPAVDDRLDDVEIIDNRFTGLTLAVAAMAQLGLIRCTNNRVANCCGGFWLVESDLGANVAFGQAALADEQQGNNLASAYTVRQFMQPVLLANMINLSAALRQKPPAAKRAATPSVSDETKDVLVSDSKTRGQAAYTSFLATDNANTSPASDASREAAQPTAGAPPASSADSPEFTNAAAAYATLQTVGVARELLGTVLVPAIYIRDNDVELVPYDTTARAPASLQGIRCMMALSATKGALFVSGNRVEAPNGSSIAISTEWGSNTVITGNLFNQLGVQYKAAQPCAVLITAERTFSAISGNVVNASWKVSPARFDIPVTTDWKFLNTVL